MEYGGEQSLNDLIEKRKEDGLQAFPAANIEKVALHIARGLQVRCAVVSVSKSGNISVYSNQEVGSFSQVLDKAILWPVH